MLTSRSARYAVQCFNPYSTKLDTAIVKDCEVIIDHVILRYPNPMTPQTFGYTKSVDFDLALPQNNKWMFGKCGIFLRNMDKTRTDTFRLADVAVAAHRIINKCVIESKYKVGGSVDVGTTEESFYVCVGGIPGSNVANETFVALASSDTNLTTPSLS